MNLIDKKVKIFFKNGLTAEGVVIEWTDKKSILKSEASDNILIINNSIDNVIMINVSCNKTTPEPIKDEIKDEIKGDFNFESRAKQHREDLIKEARSHMSKPVKQFSYGYPNFSKRRSYDDTTKKSGS